MLDKPTISIVSLAAQDLSAPKRTPRSQAARQAGSQARGGQSSATFQALAQNSITNCEKENAISWLVNQFLLFSLLSSVPPVVVAAAVAATKGATRRAQTVVPITDLCSPLVFQFFFYTFVDSVRG